MYFVIGKAFPASFLKMRHRPRVNRGRKVRVYLSAILYDFRRRENET
jgi:hypothetical protein